MINNTQTVNIDGTTLNNDTLAKALNFDKNDKFSRWVVRPLAILTVIGMGIALFFASAFIVVLSLAMMPLFALSFWAVKKKVERNIADADPVVDTQFSTNDKPADAVRVTD